MAKRKPKSKPKKRVKAPQEEMMRHPLTGDPCTYDEWMKIEIQRIVDNED